MAHHITENDQMISGRNITPWHQLGEITDEFGIPDLRRIMGWEVRKLPTFVEYAQDDFSEVQNIVTDTYATVRMPRLEEEKPITLGSGLSRSYNILQNNELIDVIEPLVEQGCMLETAGTIKQGRRVWVMLRLSGQICVSSDDLIDKYILVSNDHTGAQAAKFGLVGVRVVCNNTLTLAETDFSSQLVRIMHKGNVADNLKTVSEMLDHANGKFVNYTRDLNTLTKSGINENDLRKYVTDCFYAPKDRIKPELQLVIKKTQDKIIELFETGAGSNLASANGTVYGAYQAVNHHLNHNRDISLETRLSSLAWGNRSRIDRQAFNAAMKLAA